MDIIWIGLGILFIIIGLIGAFLPVLPGLPFSYLGLLVLQLTEAAPFSTFFLVTWGVVIAAIILLENLLPLYTSKKFGGSAYGATGSTIGMILGMLFFPPLGFFLGTLAGAFVGELIEKPDVQKALKSSWGTFVGFLTGTALKATAAATMAFYFIKALI
ncbi:MAG: DUF456 domain-containing protein [Bacteroidota bacterium]